MTLYRDRAAHSDPHYLSVELTDGNWVVFTALERSWGFGSSMRFSIGVAFLLVSILVVSGAATYRLSRAVQPARMASDHYR